MRRTFDYEPFIREFIAALQNEGLLEDALEGRRGAADAADVAASTSKAKSKGKGSNRKRG